MILDVGCGDRPRGDVNIDLGDSSHLYKRHTPAKHIPNFVCGHACYLPFRNNIFSLVLCWHTLEHLSKPSLALKEMVRVANGTVKVVVPCRWHEQIQNLFLRERKRWAKRHHKHFFDKQQLRRIVEKLKLNAKVRYHYKFSDAIEIFRQHYISFVDFIFFGVLETLLPPTPNELLLTVFKPK